MSVTNKYLKFVLISALTYRTRLTLGDSISWYEWIG